MRKLTGSTRVEQRWRPQVRNLSLGQWETLTEWPVGNRDLGKGDPSQVHNGWKKTHRKSIIIVLKERSKGNKMQGAHEREMMSVAGVTHDRFSFHKCSVCVHVYMYVGVHACRSFLYHYPPQVLRYFFLSEPGTYWLLNLAGQRVPWMHPSVCPQHKACRYTPPHLA